MAAPRKYPDELRQRATRLAVEARKDPAARTGAVKRIADQLDVHPEALRTWVKRAEHAGLFPAGKFTMIRDFRRPRACGAVPGIAA